MLIEKGNRKVRAILKKNRVEKLILLGLKCSIKLDSSQDSAKDKPKGMREIIRNPEMYP